jgi:hypothetical protein
MFKWMTLRVLKAIIQYNQLFGPQCEMEDHGLPLNMANAFNKTNVMPIDI